MLKRKVHIYAWILIFVLVIAGCSKDKEPQEENKPPEKSGLAKIEDLGGKIIYNGKKYILDPRLTVSHKKWIGKGVGLIYNSSVVYEIKELSTDEWLMGSFEHDSLVYRAQSLGRFDLTNFLPNWVEVIHEDNSNPADPKLVPGKTTMNRKIIDKIIETVTQQQPIVLDPLEPVKTKKYLDLKSNRYPMLEYHLTYKVDESGTIYLEEREETIAEAKAYQLTFDDPQEKADWESFLSQDNIPKQAPADLYDPNSDVNTQIAPGSTEKPQYTGPRYLADFQTTDEELWRLSQLAYIDGLSDDPDKNREAVRKHADGDQEELEANLEALNAIGIGEQDSDWIFFGFLL